MFRYYALNNQSVFFYSNVKGEQVKWFYLSRILENMWIAVGW